MWRVIRPGKPEFIFCESSGLTLGMIESWTEENSTIIYTAKATTRTAVKAIEKKKTTFNPDEYM